MLLNQRKWRHQLIFSILFTFAVWTKLPVFAVPQRSAPGSHGGPVTLEWEQAAASPTARGASEGRPHGREGRGVGGAWSARGTPRHTDLCTVVFVHTSPEITALCVGFYREALRLTEPSSEAGVAPSQSIISVPANYCRLRKRTVRFGDGAIRPQSRGWTQVHREPSTSCEGWRCEPTLACGTQRPLLFL